MSTNTLPLSVRAGSGRLLAIVGAVARRLAGIGRAWRHRKDLLLLASFDDRMLADIGLTRGDLRDAAAELPWRDPTTVLVSRVGERRRARPRPSSDRALRGLEAPPTVPEIEERPRRPFPLRSQVS